MKTASFLKRTVILFAFLLTAAGAGAQNGASYTNGIGIRLGTDDGITFKHFIRDDAAIEAILSTGYHAAILTVLFEKHQPLAAPGLDLFYGAGGHIGTGERVVYWYRDRWGYYYYEEDNRPYTSIGIDGIVGLEYKFNRAPFTLGIDLKPYVNIYRPGYSFLDGALSFRYAF